MLRRLRLIIIVTLLFITSLFLVNNSSVTSIQESGLAIQQLNYDLNIVEDNITLNHGGSYNLSVFLNLDGNPVDNAYFSITGINIDIGESQYYVSNGEYIIEFRNSSTLEVAPGTYDSTITAIHEGNEISTNLLIIIVSTDSVNPILEMIYPDVISNFTDVIFKIKLRLSDDVEWKDINVTLGGRNLLYFKKSLDSFNNTVIIYNQTNLIYEAWIDLREIGSLTDNNMTIIARDWALNSDSVFIQLSGDYASPVLTWTSPEDNSISTSREITLVWTVEDSSSIKEQGLKLNGNEFLLEENRLSSSQRNITVLIPTVISMKLIFTLRVTDEFDNWQEISIVVIYDAGTTDDGGLVPNLISADDKGLLLPLVIAFVVLIIAGVIIWVVKLISNRTTDDKPMKKMKKRGKLPDFPTKGLESIKLENGEQKIINDLIIRIKEIMDDQSDDSNLKISLQYEMERLQISELGKQTLEDINAVINPWIQEVLKKGGFT